MKKIIALLVLLTAAATAGDRYTSRVISLGRGKGYKIRSEIYKGSNKATEYHVHVWVKTGGSPSLTCKKVTYTKGNTYRPVEVNAISPKAGYLIRVYVKGKRVYSKGSGSSFARTVANSESTLKCLK